MTTPAITDGADLVVGTIRNGELLTIEPASPTGRSWLAQHIPASRPNGCATIVMAYDAAISLLLVALIDGLALQDRATGISAQCDQRVGHA